MLKKLTPFLVQVYLLITSNAMGLKRFDVSA